jgi:hypothetical protein
MKQAREEVRQHLDIENKREKKRAERPHRCAGCKWGKDAGCGIVTCFWRGCVRGRL